VARSSIKLLTFPLLAQEVVPPAFQLGPLGPRLALGVLVLFDQPAELLLLLLVTAPSCLAVARNRSTFSPSGWRSRAAANPRRPRSRSSSRSRSAEQPSVRFPGQLFVQQLAALALDVAAQLGHVLGVVLQHLAGSDAGPRPVALGLEAHGPG